MKELPPCPVETTLMMIGDKWKVLIIRELLPGTRRFNEIHRSIDGISQKVLTQKLREMESDNLLERRVYAEVPPKVEYSLTELGMTLRPILDSMERWGTEYKAAMALSNRTSE
jgi:DNA-binding HxlR family transcriptional regulator